MHDINKLEKKWYHYKLKKVMFPITEVAVVVFFMGGAYYAYGTQKKIASITPSQPLTRVLGVTKEVNLSEEDIDKVETVTVIKEIEELSLSPIIPIIDMDKEERIEKVSTVVKSTRQHVPLVKAKPNTYLTAKELAVITKVERRNEVLPHVTKKMKFQSQTVNYYEMMTEKFLKTKKPREALLLAKAYYKDGKYKESEKWALKANKLNSSIEESWFMFAKSKAKLGKKREALKILVRYYNKSRSPKAKILIGQIKTGKI